MNDVMSMPITRPPPTRRGVLHRLLAGLAALLGWRIGIGAATPAVASPALPHPLNPPHDSDEQVLYIYLMTPDCGWVRVERLQPGQILMVRGVVQYESSRPCGRP